MRKGIHNAEGAHYTSFGDARTITGHVNVGPTEAFVGPTTKFGWLRYVRIDWRFSQFDDLTTFDGRCHWLLWYEKAIGEDCAIETQRTSSSKMAINEIEVHIKYEISAKSIEGVRECVRECECVRLSAECGVSGNNIFWSNTKFKLDCYSFKWKYVCSLSWRSRNARTHTTPYKWLCGLRCGWHFIRY